MALLYHGTTEESYRSILSNGFDHDAVIWTCSDPQVMYFYSQDMAMKTFGLAPNKAKERCLELAAQSAFSAAALTNSQSHNLFVFEVQIPHNDLDIVQPDKSVGDWDELGVCVSTAALNQFSCNVYAVPDSYSPRLAALFLAGLRNNEYLMMPHLTQLEQEVIERLDDSAISPFLTAFEYFFTQPRLVQLHQNIRVGVNASVLDRLNKAAQEAGQRPPGGHRPRDTDPR